MDTPDETPTIAEALQRITDLAERAKREEAARQVDIMAAQGTIEALEVELLALRPKAQRAAQGEEALQALVLLGWPRETGLDPLEWAKEMRAAGPGEFEVQNSIWAVERKLAAVEKMLDDAQQQRDGKQVIIDRVRATIGVGKAESLQNRLAIIMADLEAHEKVIKEARDVAQEAIWPGRESRTEMSLVDLIGELAEGYKAANLRKQYIEETRTALGVDRSDGVTIPDAAAQLVAKLAAEMTARAALQSNYSAAMADAAGTVERAHERIFAAAELVDRLVVWAGADERHLLGKMVLDLPVQVWADRGTAIIAAVQRARDAGSRMHSWVGKVGNERCWRCHILRDSVAGTVDCPAMNKPEAPPVSG